MPVFIPFIFGISLHHLFLYYPYTTAILFFSTAVYAAVRKKLLFVLLIALGIFFAFWRSAPHIDETDIWNRELRLFGRFVPSRDLTSSGQPVRIFRPESIAGEEPDEEIRSPGSGEVIVYSEFEADSDMLYELLLKTGKDRTRLNPGGAPVSRLSGKIVSAEVKGAAGYSVTHEFNKSRDRLNRYFLQNFKPDSAGLTASVTTGETSYLSDSLKEAFAVTGLAHILSISGTHFGLFSVVLYGTFLFLLKRLPYDALQRFTLYIAPSQAAAILSLPFMAFYLGLSGASPPAVRSFIMIGLFLGGLLIGRKGAWLHSVAFAAFILLLFDPELIMNLSFQLSFIAVLFIGFALERNKDEEDLPPPSPAGPRGKALKFLKDSLMLTLAAMIGTAPLVAYHFHYLSLISPLANLIASPLIGFGLVLLSVVSSFSFLLSGHFLLGPLVSVAADLSVTLVYGLARIPYADIKIAAFPPVLCILFYAGCLLYLLSGRRKVFLAVPLLPFAVYLALSAIEPERLRVTFLDVGQGDSAVVRLPDKKTVVIDTGMTGRETAAFLKYSGVRQIDALVLTHAHPDHAGGLDHLKEKFSIKEIWEGIGSGSEPSAAADITQRTLERGDSTGGSGYSITVLHPYQGFYTRDGNDFIAENNSSAVLRISDTKASFLFAGDIEEEAEEDIFHLGTWLKSDVLKVPHHGGRSSAGADFIGLISPSIAVISVGRDNSFGHPTPEMISTLEGTRILRTDKDGAVKITSAEDGLMVKTFRDDRIEKAGSLEDEWKNIRKLFRTW
ncbi:MAG: DNA internalization-related competence protein ComEC/Rec2 [Nitrospirae bacterium]|nr:MAG: DNA internalization-related competence protein ComEC/Rec2 [Nitrospirota bacterium]